MKHVRERLLKMMHAVAWHKSVNRMSASAVAACMAPLLLRALLAGECQLECDFDISGDGSSQLLAAAAAANHAHVIVTTLLEEYDSIFGDDRSERGSSSPDMYTDSEISCSEESMEDHNLESADDGYHGEDDLDPEDDSEHSGTISKSSDNAGSDVCSYKDYSRASSDADTRNNDQLNVTAKNLMNQDQSPLQHLGVVQENFENDKVHVASDSELHDRLIEIPSLGSLELDASGLTSSACLVKTTSQPTSSMGTTKRPKLLGRTGGRRNLSMESINFSSEDGISIQQLQITKNDDLENKIVKAKGNAILQESMDGRKQALHEHRKMLEQDVARLEEQLQKERDLRATLEAGLNMHSRNLLSDSMDPKIRAELEEIALVEEDVETLKHRVSDLQLQLSQRSQHGYDSICESCKKHQPVQSLEFTRKSQKSGIGTSSGMLHHEGTERSKGARL